MSESELRSINQIPARVLIKAGSSLLVPRAAHLDTDVSLHLADHGQMALTPEAVAKKTGSKTGKNHSKSKSGTTRQARSKTSKTVRLAKH
jgi:membrane-bound lytic murein transglycosylase D